MRPIKVYKKGRTVRASSLNNPIILYLKLISHNRIEFLGLVDHALHLRHGGDAVAEIFHVVDLDKFCMQIGGNTMLTPSMSCDIVLRHQVLHADWRQHDVATH